MISNHFFIGAWQLTSEHLPSIRRYSHQPLTSSPVSPVRSRALTKKPPSITKARSLGRCYSLQG